MDFNLGVHELGHRIPKIGILIEYIIDFLYEHVAKLVCLNGVGTRNSQVIYIHYTVKIILCDEFMDHAFNNHM